jgi:Fic family protein
MVKVINKIKTDEPYNELPLLPLDFPLENNEILLQLVQSHKALAQLKGYSEILPDKNIILNTITLQEAKESSAIENIITTHDSLYKSFVMTENKVDSNVKEVLNYRLALWHGFEKVKEHKIITTNTIIEIQNKLEQNDAGIRKLPGTKLINDKTNQIIYTPPDDENIIRNLLSNLEQYINIKDDNIDPLIKLAVIHYQFESIHPFYDGNGRTGRILNVLYLVLNDLIDSPILYLSRYIINNKADYYRLFQEVRSENSWNEWIIYILNGIQETAIHTLNLIRNIHDLLDSYIETVKYKHKNIYSKELIELLFTNVYTKIGTLVGNGIASRNIARKYLNILVGLGLLQETKIGREAIFVNKPLFDLLIEN